MTRVDLRLLSDSFSIVIYIRDVAISSYTKKCKVQRQEKEEKKGRSRRLGQNNFYMAYCDR